MVVGYTIEDYKSKVNGVREIQLRHKVEQFDYPIAVIQQWHKCNQGDSQ